MTNPWWFSRFRYQKESRASRGELGRHPVANSGQGSRERTADVGAGSSGTFPLESRFTVTCLNQKDKVTDHPSYPSTPRCAYHPTSSLMRTKSQYPIADPGRVSTEVKFFFISEVRSKRCWNTRFPHRERSLAATG